MTKYISILLLILLTSCSVIRYPSGTIDSTIVTRDTIHKQGDSIIYHRRDVKIDHASKYSFKPLFWYISFLFVATILFFTLKK